MNWKDYQKNCKKMLCYKDEHTKIACSMDEITDELAEFFEHYWNSSSTELIKGEIGDICFGIAILTDEYNMQPEHLGSVAYKAPDAMREGEGFNNNTPNLFDDGLMCAAKLHGIMKKTKRDDDYKLTSTKNRDNLFRFYINSLYTYLVDLCDSPEVETTFPEVLDYNIAKLFDRKKRGVIKGDGDKR